MEFASEHGHGAENQTLIPGYQSGIEFHRGEKKKKSIKLYALALRVTPVRRLMKGREVKRSTKQNPSFF